MSRSQVRHFLVAAFKEPLIPLSRHPLPRVQIWSRGASTSSKTLHLFDSLSQQLRDVSAPQDQADDRGMACYTCGPTVYGPAHLGHARTYVCLDIVRRCWEHVARLEQRPMPLFVMNITDVDDKILAAAEASGETPLDLARRYEAAFWKDWESLNCLRPHVVTRVTEYVDSDIVPYIEQLVRSNLAYIVPNHGVYFHVRAFEDTMSRWTRYGKLAPPAQSSDLILSDHSNRPPSVKQDENDDPDRNFKRDPRDFALWKIRKDGERMHWSSPWGEGRPGWHIECSAMIEAVAKQFQKTHVFAVHAGGVDLKFPHHTNEIAQAEAFHLEQWQNGRMQQWIPHWIHTGHLHIDGRKMSKSLKNFITVEELLNDDRGAERSDFSSGLSSPADDFRLWCLGLAGTYRGLVTYSRERIDEARNIRQRIVRFLMEGQDWLKRTNKEYHGGSSGSPASVTIKWTDEDVTFFHSMNDLSKNAQEAVLNDLDGHTFIKHVLSMVDEGTAYLNREPMKQSPTEPMETVLRTLREMLAMMGFTSVTYMAGLESTANATASHVDGGERALLDAVTQFRAAVRQEAIASLDSDEVHLAKRLLELCDDTRDSFRKLGVELLDGKMYGDLEAHEGSRWRFCIPSDVPRKSSDTDMTTEAPSHRLEDLRDIPLSELFQRGPYTGLFSEFDASGIPVKNADGSDVSHRQLKKLMKKREKHAERLGLSIK